MFLHFLQSNSDFKNDQPTNQHLSIIQVDSMVNNCSKIHTHNYSEIQVDILIIGFMVTSCCFPP
jgi:hypothetical protein